MTDKLKPCPFCGSMNLRVMEPSGNPAHESWVNCNDCDLFASTKERAVELWNTRTFTQEDVERASVATYKCKELGEGIAKAALEAVGRIE